MAEPDPASGRPPATGIARGEQILMGSRLHPAVWGTVLLLVAIELALEAGNAGLLPSLRRASYVLAVGAIPPAAVLDVPGALPWFLGGLVGHALLHGGWTHLIFNAVGLLCLGHVVQAQSGTLFFMLAMALTAISGAVAFLLLSSAGNIMIGASGAVFGLLGIVLRWRSRPIPLWRVLLVLALLSLPAEFLVGGPVAWQAHIGGFLAGWVLGRVLPVRRRIIHPFM